ncbi:MAG: NAD-dependent epimerase/dehydratase family protein [Oscillospiraceae bacterium]|nr:NAD-dependent epimerase/dehydratase family protein [Oscillospiraceae bacterium]
MKNILVTGGTVFVSRSIAEYFAAKGENVFVLNRGNHTQSEGVTPIICDRHNMGDVLKKHSFDIVIDVAAYNREDVQALHNALVDFGVYVFISSSAVYPETLPQPFKETAKCGRNSIWGDYGTNKLAAEEYLLENVKDLYILRPPYLYGRGENLYRAPFIFDCAASGQTVFLPRNDLQLQFFDVSDLCKFIDIVTVQKPANRIFNVGNPNTVTAEGWVKYCFEAAGKFSEIKLAPKEIFARNYFCFYDYDYALDVAEMQKLMPETKSLKQGICEEYGWYLQNPSAVSKRGYIDYINKTFQ